MGDDEVVGLFGERQRYLVAVVACVSTNQKHELAYRG